MKNLLTILFISLLLFGCGHKEKEFTVMSYNVRNAKGMDLNVDYQRIAEIIKNSGADFIALQELDSITNRSKGIYVLKEIAEDCEMDYSYGAAIDYSEGKYGIGTISKHKINKSKTIPLPGKEEKRVMLINEFEDFVFANIHLSLTAQDRLKSVKIISEELKKYNKPIILAGDFNAKPQSETMQSFEQKGFKIISDTKQYTFPADNPNRCIDYILLMNNNKKVKIDFDNYKVLEQSVASDHRPLTIKIKLSK